MSRRGPLFAVAATATAVVSMAWSGVAPAQSPTPDVPIGHDDSLAPGDVQSGFFQLFSPDPTVSPDAQREAVAATLETYDAPGAPAGPAGTTRGNNDFTPPVDPDPTDLTGPTFEKRSFTVAPGQVNGSFTATIRWADPTIDFDLYVYRQRPNGTLDPSPIASSAQGGTVEETATFVPDRIDTPVAAGTYWVYVDNWCSADDDALDLEIIDNFGAGAEQCAPDSTVDADDWIGNITFAPLVLQNKKPTASVSGPTTGTTGEALTFTASATDPDGSIRNYAFDLDGDGRFEFDNGASNVVSTKYETAGTRSVGVRVLDDRGGVTYASTRIAITGAPAGGPQKPQAGIIQRFQLNRPVFGGRKGTRLKVRVRLREASKVTLSLYRGGKRVRRLVSDQARPAGTTFRLSVRPRGLRRGVYTLRLRAVGDVSGRKQRAVLTAKRL